jgi:hypothetical protein
VLACASGDAVLLHLGAVDHRVFRVDVEDLFSRFRPLCCVMKVYVVPPIEAILVADGIVLSPE